MGHFGKNNEINTILMKVSVCVCSLQHLFVLILIQSHIQLDAVCVYSEAPFYKLGFAFVLVCMGLPNAKHP